jgi:hypothetical protein
MSDGLAVPSKSSDDILNRCYLWNKLIDQPWRIMR